VLLQKRFDHGHIKVTALAGSLREERVADLVF
jgi:hypothetical protein